MDVCPSGQQLEIRWADQRATVAEVGGGIRRCDVGDRPVLDPYPVDAMCDGAHGAPLIPWPNRLADGRYHFDGVDYQAALSEPEKHNAIHGFLRWRPWRVLCHSDAQVTMGTWLFPLQGYPFCLEVEVAYSTYPPSWYVDLRQALDATGYGSIQLVAADSYNWTTVAADMESDPAFNQAVGIIGEHYPCGTTDCSSPSSVQAAGKPIWASEQGSHPYDIGAPALAQDLNREYVDGQMTATINWSLIWSVYAGLPYQGDGLMLANTPWSGNYTVGKSIWVMAQTAQFTQPGWRYLVSGSVRLSGGGSVVSLRSPSSDQWSSIAETGVFGPAVAVPDDAPLEDRLLGLVGRDPYLRHQAPR